MGDFFTLLLRMGAPKELVEELRRDFVEVCGLPLAKVVEILFEAGMGKRFVVQCPKDARKKLVAWRGPRGDVLWELVER